MERPGTGWNAGVGRTPPSGAVRSGACLTDDIEVLTYDPQGTVVLGRRWSDTAISHESVADLVVAAGGGLTITGSTAQNASP